MKPHEQCWVRLPLEGAHNVRELGGYPTTSGNQTKYHRFLRADGLSTLTSRDEKFLYDYGVRAVIDLRDPGEVSADRDCLVGPDVMHANIPLLGFNVADSQEWEDSSIRERATLGDLYRVILDNYEGVRSCFRFIADAPEGCVLFHCAIGKDRTGVLAMLLLSLAGVGKWDIVANYIQSRPNLMQSPVWWDQWNNQDLLEYRRFFESDPSVMEQTYDYVEEHHSGIENYLLECGVPDDSVALVRRRLVED